MNGTWPSGFHIFIRAARPRLIQKNPQVWVPQILVVMDCVIVASYWPSGNPDTWQLITKGVQARYVSPN